MADAFDAGSTIRVGEVLHGSEWAYWDERVVGDDGTLMTFPEHRAPHPWGHVDLDQHERAEAPPVPRLALGVEDLRRRWRLPAPARITAAELLATLDATAEVADLLERDDRWWAPWDDWTPADGTIEV